MNKGIYIAVSGSVLKQLQIEAIAQNIANSVTPTYKRKILSFRDYIISEGIKDGKEMTALSRLATDFSPGELIHTGNTLDLAIEGKGFFVLEGGFYTRSGNFKKDGKGFLVTAEGRKVMGENGPIRLPAGDIIVRGNGEIEAGGLIIGKLKIIDFNNYGELEQLQGGLIRTKQKPIQSKASIRQGFIEGSNVNIVQEMTKMIEAMREFELFQKAVQTLDEASARINNEIGRI